MLHISNGMVTTPLIGNTIGRGEVQEVTPPGPHPRVTNVSDLQIEVKSQKAICYTSVTARVPRYLSVILTDA